MALLASVTKRGQNPASSSAATIPRPRLSSPTTTRTVPPSDRLSIASERDVTSRTSTGFAGSRSILIHPTGKIRSTR